MFNFDIIFYNVFLFFHLLLFFFLKLLLLLLYMKMKIRYLFQGPYCSGLLQKEAQKTGGDYHLSVLIPVSISIILYAISRIWLEE